MSLTSAQYGFQKVNGNWGSTPQRPVSYTWDKAGNRVCCTDNGAACDYLTSNLNQYTAAGADTVYSGSEHEISNYKGQSYLYVNDERLASISQPNGASTDNYQLAYDALGRCVKRTLNGVIIYYVYDGEKPILEYNNVYQRVGWNLYGKGIDEILMRTDYVILPSGQGYFYQQDHEGSVTHLTGWMGEVIESYRYDAFGAITTTTTTGVFNNRFMFTGREYAQKFGVYEYRNRAYHPGLGRFMSEDPMGFDAGDYNLFRYCGDDPIDRVDPMGLQAGHQSSSVNFWYSSNNMFWDDVRQLQSAANAPSYSIALTYEGPKGEKSKGAEFKDYGNWVDGGLAGATQAINKGGRTLEWGGEIFENEDGSAGVFITSPHPGVGVRSIPGRGSVQCFVPDPGRVPEGHKMIGFYWSHTRPAQDIPLYDRQFAYGKGWHAVLAAPRDPGTMGVGPKIITYEYVSGNPPR